MIKVRNIGSPSPRLIRCEVDHSSLSEKLSGDQRLRWFVLGRGNYFDHHFGSRFQAYITNRFRNGQLRPHLFIRQTARTELKCRLTCCGRANANELIVVRVLRRNRSNGKQWGQNRFNGCFTVFAFAVDEDESSSAKANEVHYPVLLLVAELTDCVASRQDQVEIKQIDP